MLPVHSLLHLRHQAVFLRHQLLSGQLLPDSTDRNTRCVHCDLFGWRQHLAASKGYLFEEQDFAI